MSARSVAISHFTARWKRFPRSAARDFRAGARALVDQSLLLQFHAQVGDPIKIGDLDFTIAGALTKMPGEASAAGSFAPRVYIPLQDLAATNLLKPGSIARYRDYVKFPEGTDVAQRIEILAPQIQRLGLEYDTVAKRKKDLGTALENLYRFLNLVGFVSLLLGAVGVASAIQAHLQQKTKTGAILRCLGMSSQGTVLVYLLQTAAMGLVGATTGAALGVAMQRFSRAFCKHSCRWRFRPRSPGSQLSAASCLALRSASCLRCRRSCGFGGCRLCAFCGPTSISKRNRQSAIQFSGSFMR